MPQVQETLQRLATTFTVRDIMTSRLNLICATDQRDAVTVSNKYPDFDVIPIRNGEHLTGYFERSIGRASEITRIDLIGDGTNLLELVEIFEKRRFSFVLSQQHIAGYVHFSDLNHHLVKLTYYVVLEALERTALSSLRSEMDRAFLEQHLDGARFRQIEASYKRAGQASRSLASYLNISDILRLASKTGSLTIEESAISAVKRIRDGAAHASENLVNSYESVAELAMVKRECLRILASPAQSTIAATV